MASFASVERECEKKNQARNVDCRNSCDLLAFYEAAGSGRYLISGGTSEKREEALAKKIAFDAGRHTMPTVILNTSPEFDEKLTKIMRSEPDPDYLSFSTLTKNYHVFYGMNSVDIRSFLYERALKVYERVNDQFGNYVDAFLSVLEKFYPPSLPAMLNLAELTDEAIAENGRIRGVESWKLDMLRQNPEAGVTFRNLLSEMMVSFRNITTKDCESGLSLLSMEKDMENFSVIMITMDANRPEVLNNYFARELRELRTRRPFRLILNGMPVSEQDDLLAFIDELRSRPGIEFGICDEDILYIIADENKLVNFPVQVIFLRQYNEGITPAVQLSHLGDYYHYEVSRGGGHGETIFHPISSGQWNVVKEQRQRIRLEDLPGYAAVLKGLSGEHLLMVKKLK